MVEVRLRPSYAQWRYRLDVIVDQRYIYFDTFSRHVQNFKGLLSLHFLKSPIFIVIHFLGVTVYTPTSIINQSHVVVMFASGAGVEVVENNRHMSARVYLPLSYMVFWIASLLVDHSHLLFFCDDRIKPEVYSATGQRLLPMISPCRTVALLWHQTSTIWKLYTTNSAWNVSKASLSDVNQSR